MESIIRKQPLVARFDNVRPASIWRRSRPVVKELKANKRLVRYSLVGSNILLLLAIAWFTLGPTHRGQPLGRQGVINTSNESASEPLDQLSAADIAVSASLAVGLYEAPGVIELANSVKTEQTIAPADTTVIAKPQVVATSLKSYRDIQEYVVVAGDTVASIAAKFSVTSDSIMWSNNLRSNSVNAGLKLTIPPSGVNGIVYTVRTNDTVDNLAQRFRANKEQITVFNDIELTGLVVGQKILIPNGQQPAPVVVSRPTFRWAGGYNGYDRGFCTWYVANRRSDAGRALPSNLGNASTWDDRAAAMGLSVNKSPSVGDAVVTSQRGAGHVAYVEVVNEDGSIWVSEMNSSGQVSMTDTRRAGNWNQVDWKLIPANVAAGHNYIH